MDHYKVLGLSQTASKEEIKESFRNLAKQFHPDKHSNSPKSMKDAATLKFRQASEAYEVLIDDCKRAEYNLRSRTSSGSGFNSDYAGRRHDDYRRRTRNYSDKTGYEYGYGFSSKAANGHSFGSRFEIHLRYLTTRSFLLNLVFAGMFLGGSIIVENGRNAIWKMQNSGKSFEEAMESVEKGKSAKEKR